MSKKMHPFYCHRPNRYLTVMFIRAVNLCVSNGTFNSVKAFQGKMNSFIPTIKPTMIMHPAVLASGPNIEDVDFSQLFQETNADHIILDKSIHDGKPLSLSWTFDDYYIIENVSMAFCPHSDQSDETKDPLEYTVEGLMSEVNSQLSIPSKLIWKTLNFYKW